MEDWGKEMDQSICIFNMDMSVAQKRVPKKARFQLHFSMGLSEYLGYAT